MMRRLIRTLLPPMLGLTCVPAQAASCGWQPAWVSSQMAPDAANALPAAALADSTLRQIVRVSTGGLRFRVRFSNAFGRAPLTIPAASVGLAVAPGSAAVRPQSVHRLTFSSAASVVVPPGADWLSDPVALPLVPFADLAVSLRVTGDPDGQTAHPGSRATSYVIVGDHVADLDLTGAQRIDRWFLLSAVEVEACPVRGGIVALGDSITDGRGSTTNGNDRWTDVLAERLGGRIAVLNQGIGGNRVLLDGLGPSALARLDRDVLAQPGVRDVVLLEGINDLGSLTREAPATPERHAALVAQITQAYAQIVARAHAHGMRVHGGTLLPFMGTAYYHPDAANEADRQAVNTWIRAPGHFDSVIDFDAALRDPAQPDRLKPAYDSGDRLHPNPAGYRAMAQAIPLDRFR